jgi:hypothetical protein
MTDTATDLRFTIDNGQRKTWTALRFGNRWNGWLTPVVDRDTLESIFDFGEFDEGEYTLTFEPDDTAVITDNFEGEVLRLPDDHGYDLFHLGWCFEEATWTEEDRVASLAKVVAAIEAEIREFVEPGQVRTFSELHDICDANMIGHEEVLRHENEFGANWIDFINGVQDEVDAWLRNGMEGE